MAITYATMKIEIAIENGRSLKLRQTSFFNSITTKCEALWAVPGPLMGPWRGIS